jgi:hypothetical protein
MSGASARVDPEIAVQHRLALPLALVIVAVSGSTAAAHVAAASNVVHPGQAVQLTVARSGSASCLASVRYSDGAGQDSGAKHPSRGKVTWTIRVPNTAALGVAHWTVHCGATWSRSGTWRVVARPSAAPTVPTILIVKNGFSQRNDDSGGGSRVSFGIVLKNQSGTRDAQNVYLLINFVDASGRLLGSMNDTIPQIAAGQSYGYGNEMILRTSVAVTKLEVTVRPQAGVPATQHPLPHFANVQIFPDPDHPEWMGEVDGEIVNDTSQRTMDAAKLSIVVYDGVGNVVGGGNMTAGGKLPSGSRMVFIAQSGFKDIPMQNAVSVVITVEPAYEPN